MRSVTVGDLDVASSGKSPADGLPVVRPHRSPPKPGYVCERFFLMLWLALGVALLAASAIIAIGVMYLATPRAATRSLGLPLPEDGANIAWWLRLKGAATSSRA